MSSALLNGTMSSQEAAEYLSVSLATLKRWRGSGSGPEYIQLSERIIRYRQVDLDGWILKRRMNGQKKE